MAVSSPSLTEIVCPDAGKLLGTGGSFTGVMVMVTVIASESVRSFPIHLNVVVPFSFVLGENETVPKSLALISWLMLNIFYSFFECAFCWEFDNFDFGKCIT